MFGFVAVVQQGHGFGTRTFRAALTVFSAVVPICDCSALYPDTASIISFSR